MRIFLIGFMGSGKTYTGSRLAQRLKIPFVDLDLFIEEQAGKSITQIFETEGEDQFRRFEKKALHQMKQFKNVVISCGGGTPCFFDNMDWMKRHGKIIYLDLSPSTLEQRLKKEKAHRPLIKNLDSKGHLLTYIISKLKERNFFYRQADLIFSAENESLEPWIALEKLICI